MTIMSLFNIFTLIWKSFLCTLHFHPLFTHESIKSHSILSKRDSRVWRSVYLCEWSSVPYHLSETTSDITCGVTIFSLCAQISQKSVLTTCIMCSLEWKIWLIPISESFTRYRARWMSFLLRGLSIVNHLICAKLSLMLQQFFTQALFRSQGKCPLVERSKNAIQLKTHDWKIPCFPHNFSCL